MTAISPSLPDLTAAAEDDLAGGDGRTAPTQAPLTFDGIYEEHVDFVWRGLKSLGVGEQTLDDAVQDVFMVVHRRLPDFEARSAIQTWLFGIVMRVARDHRRRERRKGGLAPLDFEVIDGAPSPHEAAARSEALRALSLVLEHLDDDKRAVFVLAELEQRSAPEIAAALGINVNTVYSRLRAARRAFETAFAAHRGEGR
ncbi:RNA polymerase sigma factor RpoE [Minicystis rosea]|nr:RNA polymerase sigma factor RpoE [Minicystis rosea]